MVASALQYEEKTSKENQPLACLPPGSKHININTAQKISSGNKEARREKE